MTLDHGTLVALRQHHPAWRLLRAESAPLVASFLHRVYVSANARTLSQSTLAEALDDTLFALRAETAEQIYPRSALEYLDEWAANERGWLRKFYPPGSDEAHFDPTPAAEKAIAWLASLAERSFVGTESRLLTLFSLLEQMSEGSRSDPDLRLGELRRRRADIDREIDRVAAGDFTVLSDTAMKERFVQFTALARDLLADFREVEHNFRGLDRRVRERVALWDGGKGALLNQVMGERDDIADSDQGRSFRSFWDFLMSQARQEEMTARLDEVLGLAAVAELDPDPRLRRIHHDWLEAGEHAQRTVALLSQQLRRFLDDQAWLENRRIMDILRSIETSALSVREAPPAGDVMTIAETAARIELPMERPLHSPPLAPRIADVALEAGEVSLDTEALFAQFVIDRAALASHLERSLRERPQVSLGELLRSRHLQQGLAELVAWFELAAERDATVSDDDSGDTVTWIATNGAHKRARLPHVIFRR